METNKLVDKLNEIEMSKEMQNRIIRNCSIKREAMLKNKTNNFFKKPMLGVASLILCFCLIGLTTLAATGKLQGFFKDIKRWDGAVTGTSYKEATDEIEISVVTKSDELIVLATILDPKKAPYSIFEVFGVEHYKIIDMSGNIMLEGKGAEMAQIVDGRVSVSIPVADLTSGNYKLVVDQFIGSAKAEQPLIVNGTWECEFTH